MRLKIYLLSLIEQKDFILVLIAAVYNYYFAVGHFCIWRITNVTVMYA